MKSWLRACLESKRKYSLKGSTVLNGCHKALIFVHNKCYRINTNTQLCTVMTVSIQTKLCDFLLFTNFYWQQCEGWVKEGYGRVRPPLASAPSHHPSNAMPRSQISDRKKSLHLVWLLTHGHHTHVNVVTRGMYAQVQKLTSSRPI